MKQSKKEVSVVDQDFHRTARLSNKNVFAHFEFICRVAKKSPVPKTIKTNAYRVARTPRSVTIHFLWVDPNTKAEEETLRFNFLPPPRFA
jgi:hypothetical protein